MFGARRALALLAGLAAARAFDECDTVTVGSTHGNSIQLPDVTLARGSRVFGLDLLARGISPCPPGSVLVGSTMTACDWNNAPVVSMDIPTYAIVTRTNSLATPAVVQAAVYCRPASAFPGVGAGALDVLMLDWQVKPKKKPPKHYGTVDVQSPYSG